MNWDDLHDFIPYAKTSQGYRPHQFSRVPYEGDGWRIGVTCPGNHEFQTEPKGGDFAITVKAANWAIPLFTRRDIWLDLEIKCGENATYVRDVFAPALVSVVAEERDPDDLDVAATAVPGLDPSVLLRASQCLALCEWRRFWSYEPEGGRCLATRFALGIIFGRWTSAMASNVWREGLSGLRTLELLRGATSPSFREVLGRDPVQPHCAFRQLPRVSRAEV